MVHKLVHIHLLHKHGCLVVQQNNKDKNVKTTFIVS